MEYTYHTKDTCSRIITFTLKDNVVSNVKFEGGCPGNLQAIPKLVEGMTVQEIEKKLKGINCSRRGTSCADQLAIAVRKAYEESKESKK